MVSLAEERSYETSMAFDQASREQVATNLKSKYQLLYDLSQGRDNKFGLIPPADSGLFDQFIMDLSDEVIEGRSDRSLHIRGLIQKLDPSEYEKLESIDAIKESATSAVESNTGYFSFLGGSTIMNALAGLFKWVFSGFSGGFAGLKDIIAEGAVTNTITSFKNNLAERGIDPTTGLGESVVAQFEQKARIEAGLDEAPNEPEFSLRTVAIERLRSQTAAASTVSADEIQADPSKAMREHFTSVATNIKTEISTLINSQSEDDISASDKKKYIDLISRASTSMTEHAMELANPPTNVLQNDFNERLVIATLKDAKSDLDPTADKAISDKIDFLINELGKPGATLGSVMADAVQRGDKVSAGLLATFQANLQQGQPTLIKIVQAAAPGDQSVALAAHNAEIDAERRRTEDAKSLSASFANIIDQRLEAHITSKAIREAIDQKIAEEVERKYPTNPAEASPVNIPFTGIQVWGGQTARATFNSVVGDNMVTRFVDNLTYLGAKDEMPDPADRDKIATFTSDELKIIMREKLTEIMDNPELQSEFIVNGKLDKEKFNQAVIDEYKVRLEAEGKKDNGGRVGSFFARKENQTLIIEGIKAELDFKITDELAAEIGKGISEIQKLKGSSVIAQTPSQAPTDPAPENEATLTENVVPTSNPRNNPQIEEKVRQLATSPFGNEGSKTTIAKGLIDNAGLSTEQANAAVNTFIATTTAKMNSQTLATPSDLAESVIDEMANDKELVGQLIAGVRKKRNISEDDLSDPLLTSVIKAQLKAQATSFFTANQEELRSIVGAPKNEITMHVPGEYDQNFEGPGYTPAGAKPLQQPSQNIA